MLASFRSFLTRRSRRFHESRLGSTSFSANTRAQVLLSSFVRFVADGDKEALVAALLSVLGQHNPKLAGPVSSPAVYGDDDEHDSVTGAYKFLLCFVFLYRIYIESGELLRSNMRFPRCSSSEHNHAFVQPATAAALQQRQELIDQYQIIQAQAQQLELRKQYLLHEQAKLRQLQEQTHRAAAQQYGRWDDYDDGQDDEDDDAAEDGSAEKYRYAAQMVESYDRAAEQTGGDRFDDEYGYDGDDRDDDEAAEPEHNHPLLSLTSLDLPCIRHNLVESGCMFWTPRVVFVPPSLTKINWHARNLNLDSFLVWNHSLRCRFARPVDGIRGRLASSRGSRPCQAAPMPAQAD